ncbi:hypothetical protein GBA52_015711 [Prunus armeniaca]|nr:hypothetical protein GBA52_015711 [Prunus armeniaca]
MLNLSSYKGTLESIWNFISTSTKKQADGNGDVEVDTQNSGFYGSAKAHSSLEVYEVELDQR